MKSRLPEAGVLFVLGAALCWGTTGTAQAFAPAGASSLSVGAARLVVGGAALVLLGAGRGLWGRWRELPLWPTLGAAVAMALYQITFFAGVRRTGVAVGTIIAIAGAPIIAGPLSLLVGQRPSRRWAFSTMLAILGSVLLVIGSGTLRAEPLGILLAVATGGSYALYTLFSMHIVSRVPTDLAAGATFGLGALLILPVLLLSDTSWLASTRGLAVALHLGLIATALAYFLYTRALRTIPMSTAVTLALGEPMVASLLGVALLGERLTLRAWVGVLLILAGLFYLTVGRNRSQDAHDAQGASAHV